MRLEVMTNLIKWCIIFLSNFLIQFKTSLQYNFQVHAKIKIRD